MDQAARLTSKVLVLDGDVACHDCIKSFCDEHRLIALKAQADNVMTVLRSNVDLGAIFISERFNDRNDGGVVLARAIRAARPELPLFLRRANDADPLLRDLGDSDRECFRAGYTADAMSRLSPIIEQSIFSLVYPTALVRGIEDLTLAALNSQFVDVQIEVTPPQVVRDRIIVGEVFSLIPLESDWGRGYLLLQTEENSLMEFVRRGKTWLPRDFDTFRDVNNVLSELTNLVWGTFKSRFVFNEESSGHVTQVPIVVNHLHRYISFGSEDPQLCFRFTLHDPDPASPLSVVVDQRFIFNLKWMPDNFREGDANMNALISTGSLDIF